MPLRRTLTNLLRPAARRAALALVIACAAPASAPADQSRPPVTDIQSFWNIPLPERRRGVDYVFEGDVTYCDPIWGHFWLQDTRTGTYFEFGSGSPEIREGRRIRISGRTRTDYNLNATAAQVAVLGPRTTVPRVLPTEGWCEQPEQYENLLVELEAHVDRQVLSDPGHLHLFLSAGGRSLFGWVLLPPGEPEPRLERTTIRLRGVFTSMRSADGHLTSIELKIQAPSSIQVLHHLEDDPRFAAPVSTIAALRQRPRDALVHVIGAVRSQQPDASLTLRDDTGQIEVLSGQSLPCRIGETAEAIGYPEIVGTEWKLRAALFRPYRLATTNTETAPPSPGLPVLRVASRVLELSAKEASQHFPVELSGVITWSRPDAPFLFIHDSSGGICVQRGEGPAPTFEPGRSVVVRGSTTMGEFAPAVVANTILKTGDMPLPRTEAISLEQALTGRAEAQWIELRGLVRAIHREAPWNRLEIATAAGDFAALLPAADEPPPVIGAVVRVRGVCTADTDTQRRLLGVRLWVRAPEDIQIEEAAPADLFALPAQSLAELGRFGAPQSSERRVRLSGVVLAQSSGRWIQIQDGDVSLRVLGGSGPPAAPGRQIEAVGYLNRKGGRMILREAVYRDIGEGQLPAPRPFSGTIAEAVALDGQLVTADGLLLSRIPQVDETRMTLHSPAGLFAVSADSPVATGIPLQSQVTVTGLMDISYDEQGLPTGFRVRLRSPADIVLVQRPSWLTRGRILAIASALGLGVGLTLLWVAALRRRVRRQTGQIREQMRREAHLEAELQRATRLESLGLLAGGIAHDFNNLLTIIIGNLSMASLGKTPDREVRDNVLAASRATMRARDLTQQLLTFAKGGSPVRSTLALPELVRDVTEFVLRGSAVDCEFRCMPGLWPAHADKGQISQVVQNLVINAVQAMPEGGHIQLTLANDEIAADDSRVLAPGRYLRLEISDTGAGIAPDVLPRIFDPYFTTKQTGSGIGLATVYSIVRKHGGHITVDSSLGVGTTFRLWLPASNSAPDAAPSATDTNAASLSGRVLLMDDEADIRALASQMMQHLGLNVHCVADGTAAVDEYSRALRDRRRYDLVVLDLTVPGGLGGLQALRRLRAIDPDVVAVVSSGYSADEVMASYRSHGFRAMVPKPYGIEELARALRPLLNSQPGAN